MEIKLRKYLWLNHRCRFLDLYGDDGEMQCGHCMIDFKRDPEDQIVNQLIRKSQNLEEAKKPSTNIEKSLIPLDVVEELILKWVGENGRREISHLLHEYKELEEAKKQSTNNESESCLNFKEIMREFIDNCVGVSIDYELYKSGANDMLLFVIEKLKHDSTATNTQPVIPVEVIWQVLACELSGKDANELIEKMEQQAGS